MFLSWVKENRAEIWTFMILSTLAALLMFFPEVSFAQFGGSGFESKIQSINSSLITRILPLLSVLGLVYASVLAINGDEGAKGKILMVLIASVIGFLAPTIVEWLKGLAM